jgi:hypothetical protein
LRSRARCVSRLTAGDRDRLKCAGQLVLSVCPPGPGGSATCVRPRGLPGECSCPVRGGPLTLARADRCEWTGKHERKG